MGNSLCAMPYTLTQHRVGREKASDAGRKGAKAHPLCIRALSKAGSPSLHNCMAMLVLWPHFTDADAGIQRS